MSSSRMPETLGSRVMGNFDVRFMPCFVDHGLTPLHQKRYCWRIHRTRRQAGKYYINNTYISPKTASRDHRKLFTRIRQQYQKQRRATGVTQVPSLLECSINSNITLVNVAVVAYFQAKRKGINRVYLCVRYACKVKEESRYGNGSPSQVRL